MKAALFSVITLVSIASAPSLARDQIHIVSTPSDFHFTTMVGEYFARSYHQPVPLVERRSASTAVKYFCAGVGRQHPDVVGLARPLQVHEFDRCQENGVKRVTEIKFGYDGVVVASGGARDPFPLTRRQLFQALAAKLPVDGEIVRNPYRKWNEIDPQLPDMPIKLVGPLLDSDMGQATIQLIMEPGCRSFPEIAELGEQEAARICSTVRGDGVFEQISRTYDDALRDVASSRRVTAILPYTVFEQNAHRIAAHPIEGVVPDEVTIAMNSYPVTCPLYLYVKLAHYDRVPGILEFVAEYTSDRAWGPEGYLADSGLVPLSHRDRIDQRANAIGLNPILR